MTPADDREAFENWHAKEWPQSSLARGDESLYGPAAYVSESVRNRYVGWKASTERAREPDSNSQNQQSNVTEAAVQVPLAPTPSPRAEVVKILAGRYARAMTRTNLIAEREDKSEIELEVSSEAWCTAITHQESVRDKLFAAVDALARGEPVAEASGSNDLDTQLRALAAEQQAFDERKSDEQNPHPGQQAGAES